MLRSAIAAVLCLCSRADANQEVQALASSPLETIEADSIRTQLLIARAKQAKGEYSAARAILLQALDKAPDSASLVNALGSVEQDLGQYMEAERTYFRALSLSARIKGDPEHLLLLNNLATLIWKPTAIERQSRQLESLSVDAFASEPGRRGRLMNLIGLLKRAQNKKEEAERYYSLSLDRFREIEGYPSLDAASAQANLGSLRLEGRQYKAAADLLKAAIGEIEAAAGPDNPALIRLLIMLARCEEPGGNAREAELTARRAMELSTKILPAGHPLAAAAMLEQATAFRRLREKAKARDVEKLAQAWLRQNSSAKLSTYTVDVRALSRDSVR